MLQVLSAPQDQLALPGLLVLLVHRGLPAPALEQRALKGQPARRDRLGLPGLRAQREQARLERLVRPE